MRSAQISISAKQGAGSLAKAGGGKLRGSAAGRNAAGGLFISFEGGEGSGKSTQIQRAAAALRAAGQSLVVTREPGGTAGAEALRHILLKAGNYSYSPLLEAVLFAAARRDHVEQVIAPALARGMIVLCDRFLDSTRVYQGLSGRVSAHILEFLETIAVESYRPQLSFFLDIDAAEGMARAHKRRGAAEKTDRFEKDSLNIQERRRRAFLKIARSDKERCRIINAARPAQIVAADILAQIAQKTGLPLREGEREPAAHTAIKQERAEHG